MADASDLGLDIDADAMEAMTSPEATEICRALSVDPLGLIAAGGLLLAVAPDDATAVIAALEGASIRATQIGRAVPRSQGVNIPRFARDELARILEG